MTESDLALRRSYKEDFDESAAAWRQWHARTVARARRWRDSAAGAGRAGKYRSRPRSTGGEVLYLVESLPPKTLWDLSDVAPTALQVQALTNGLWQARGTFPVAGRPKLTMAAPAGPRGAGSYTAFAELTLHPGDTPGVELEDGTVVGHDPDTQTWVVR